MILLEPESYPKVIELIKEVNFNHLFAITVLENKMPGEVYVDNTENPKTFLIRHYYNVSLLFGECNNDDFNQNLVSYILNVNKSRKSTEWLQTYPSNWNDKLKSLLKINSFIDKPSLSNSVLVELDTRLNFKFNHNLFQKSKPSEISEVHIVRTNAKMFNQIRGTVVPEYFWRNDHDFENNGVGFSAIVNGIPVSTGFSAYVHSPLLEIGIETMPEWQGKGFAKLVSEALIEYCIKNSFEPVWACRLSNIGSFKLAQKLGFEVSLMIPYYKLPV